MKNLKKFLPLFALVLGLGLIVTQSAFKAIKPNTETVAMTSPGVWEVVDPLQQGITWDCFPEGEACKGDLKEGAIPNPDGTYPTSEVENIQVDSHFDLL